MTQLMEKNLSLWAVFFHNYYLWEFLHLPLTRLGEASVWDELEHAAFQVEFHSGGGMAGQPGSDFQSTR